MKRPYSQALLFLSAAGFSAVVGAQGVSGESAYPTKPIRIVVPFSAGSATDIMARLVGSKLVDHWGRQVVTDNRPSAGGIIACGIVAEAEPDGHTLLVTGSNFAGSAALYSKLPYDPVKDFSGVTQLGSTPLVLVVAPNLGVKSLKEFVALARAKPGQLNFGSAGIGSGTHYGAELFNLVADIKGVHVPYRGSPEALNDVIAGRVQFFFSPTIPAMSLIKSGKLLALAVSTRERAPPLPDVPTAVEAGVAQYEYEGWYGMLAPSRTQRRIINLLAKELGRILEQPDIKERIASQGAVAKSSTPQAFDKLVRDEITTRRNVWKAAGVNAE
jgi:tripartite-type tricarboxylate transporter receptor subunit TctC